MGRGGRLGHGLRYHAPAVRVRPRTLSLVALTVVALCVACNSSSRQPASARPDEGLRASGTDTAGGSGDALAAILLIGAATPVQHGGRPTFMTQSRLLEERMAFHAQANLEATAFGGGVASGASIAGSQRLRRLAASAGAPTDGNGNGTNLDEMADLELTELAALAGGTSPTGAFSAWLPWRAGTTELLAAPGTRADFGNLRVRASAAAGFASTAGQVGAAMLARVHGAARLLAESRGAQPGRTPQEGTMGLLLLQQAVAAEETLVAKLFGRDGTLAGLPTPRAYDPRSPGEASWVPAQFVAELDPQLPGAPVGYAVVDRASSLAGLSVLLEAAAELAWLASSRSGNAVVRNLLTVTPFGPGVPRGGRAIGPAPVDDEVTFDSHIRPLVQGNCFSCHNDFTPQGGFTMGRTVVEYDKFLTPGNIGRRGNPPHLVPGDHRRSLLWQALSGNTTLMPRMPLACGPVFNPCWPAARVAVVAEWIDKGLRRAPSIPPPPPRVGEDLARALVRNLLVLHLDPDVRGALHDRYEGDAPSRLVRARSLGAALQALAVAGMALGPGNEALPLLRSVADFARTHLLTPDDGVHGELALAAGGGAAPLSEGDAVDHAALVAGMFAAARVLDDAELLAVTRRVSRRWFDTFWSGLGVFGDQPGSPRMRLGADELGVVLAALQEAAADDDVAAANHHEALLQRVLPVLVASEWDGLGEVLGDGIADTDRNGIPEPALAGGPHGRAPMFAAALLSGTAPGEPSPVSWSQEILPLFRSACAGCHTDGAVRGAYRLDTPTMAATAGESGRVGELIVPGAPERSLLYLKLIERRPSVGDQMPLQRPPLSDGARELVRRWILEGARGR